MSALWACAASAAGCSHTRAGHPRAARCAFTSRAISCTICDPSMATPVEPPAGRRAVPPDAGRAAGTASMHAASRSTAAAVVIHRIVLSLFLEAPQQLHHPQVERVGGGIVVADL